MAMAADTRRVLRDIEGEIVHRTLAPARQIRQDMAYRDMQKWLLYQYPGPDHNLVIMMHFMAYFSRALASTSPAFDSGNVRKLPAAGGAPWVGDPRTPPESPPSPRLESPYATYQFARPLCAAIIVWLGAAVAVTLGAPTNALGLGFFLGVGLVLKTVYNINKLHRRKHGEYLVSPHYLIGGFAVTLLLALEAGLLAIKQLIA